LPFYVFMRELAQGKVLAPSRHRQRKSRAGAPAR